MDALIIPFSLFFIYGCLVLQYVAVLKGDVFGFFFALLFVIGSIYMALGRFFISQHYRRRMTYAVGTRKAYILSQAFSGQIKQKPITKEIGFTYSMGRKSTIVFNVSDLSAWQRQRIIVWPSHSFGFEFFRIEQGEHVMSLLRQVRLDHP